MTGTLPEREHNLALVRQVIRHFEELSEELERALEELPADTVGGEEWQRLQRARANADKGAALARSMLAGG
jgi:hypothetical protein